MIGLDIQGYLMKKRKFLSVKEIAKGTNQSIQSVSRKVKRLSPRYIEKKVKTLKVGNRTSKCPVNYYRYKK